MREAARVFARLLQRVLVERLVVGLLTDLSALCRVDRIGLGGRGLLGHAPSISAPHGASSCPVRGAFRHEKATRADGLVQRFGRGGGTRTRTGVAHVLLRHARLPIPPRPDVGYNQVDRRKLGLRGPGRPPVIFLARIFGRFLPRRSSLYPDHREAVPCGQVPHLP